MDIEREPDPEALSGDVMEMDAPQDGVGTKALPCAGTHLIIDVREAEGLDCPDTVERALREAVTACRATLLHIHLHKFSPQGVSGVAVLAESHVSVHTWPEAAYGAFDVFMCGDADPHAAVPVLRRAFRAGRVDVREIRRGEGLDL